jgi:hypothetical protein
MQRHAHIRMEDDAACSAAGVLPVAAAARSGQAPFGINDEDVDRYWRETMQPQAWATADSYPAMNSQR